MNNLVMNLQNVGLFYGRNRGVFGQRFWALKDVSFNLYKGDSLGVIGRNGVGKSTLLRLMAGLMRPDRGKLINYDQRASLLSLQVGFVPYLSGRENAILSGMLMGIHRREVLKKLDDIIEFSELGDFIHQPIATYSSGMIARLGFAVAFQVEPDILLIDEVLGVGDAEFSQKSAQVMQEKIRDHKTTIVFVSHNAALVEQLCNRTVWIENGVSVMEGNTPEVLHAYYQSLHI